MFSYTNRRGVIHYIHEARTKAGGRRYVAKRTIDGQDYADSRQIVAFPPTPNQ